MHFFSIFSAICAITRPSYALLIGAIGSLIACASCKILSRLRVDDPVGCVPVHLCSGIWSLIAVAFFSEPDKSGYFASENIQEPIGTWRLLGAQVLLTAASCAWSACITLLLLTSINVVLPIRMSLEDELKGSDACEHGIPISLSGSFKEARGSSAFGSRKLPGAQWVEENSLCQAGGSGQSASIQTVDQDCTTSNISNESEHGGDLIQSSPLGISFEPRTSVILTDGDIPQANGQPNLGFTTNF